MILIRTKLYEERPLDVARDAWRVFMREAHAIQGAFWHREMLPGHFTEGAKFKYHHQARTAKYKKRKRREAANGTLSVIRIPGVGTIQSGPVLMGGVVDNVYRGTLMRSMLNTPSIRAYPSRVTVTMSGPNYIGMKPNRYAGSNQPHKAQEIIATTRDEQKKLGQVLEEAVTARLNGYRAPRTTTT